MKQVSRCWKSLRDGVGRPVHIVSQPLKETNAATSGNAYLLHRDMKLAT